MHSTFSSGYHKSLDGLRGMAVLLVWLYHYTKFAPFNRFTGIGWIGADLFFVLSGFLITGILLDNKLAKGVYGSFIVRRALRIFPLYWLVLITSIVGYLFLDIEDFRQFYTDRIYFWTYTQNFSVAWKGWVYPQHNHFWTLAIEEQFYLFWPLIVLFFRQQFVLWIALLLMIGGLIIRNMLPETPFAYTFTLCRLDGLLIGSVLAILIRRQRGIHERISILSLIFSMVALVGLALFYDDLSFDNAGFARFGYTLLGVLFGALIALLFIKNRLGKSLKRVFEKSFLVVIGKYSYGIYVYHYIIYKLLDIKIIESLKGYVDGMEAKLSSAIICSLLTFVISYISYNFFEKKLLQLKSLVPYKARLQTIN